MALRGALRVLIAAGAFVLGGCVDPITARDVRRMAADLRSDRPEVRAQGLEAASTFQRPSCHWPLAKDAVPVARADLVPALVPLLDAADRDTRAQAARTLEGLALRDAFVAPSGEASSGPPPDVAAALVRALDREECAPAARCLADLDPVPEAAVAPLTRLLRGEGYEYDAASTLARAGPLGRRALLDALRDSDLRDSKRWSAANGLGEVALEPAEVEELVRATETDPDAEGRRRALGALTGSAKPGAAWLARVWPRLSDPDGSVQARAGELIGRGGDADGSVLRRALDLLRSGPRRGAVALVATVGATEAAVPALAAVVRDDAESDEVRRSVLRALRDLGKKARAALPAIDHRLAHPADAFEWNDAKYARDAIAPPPPFRGGAPAAPVLR